MLFIHVNIVQKPSQTWNVIKLGFLTEAHVWKINILNVCLIKIRLFCDMVVLFFSKGTFGKSVTESIGQPTGLLWCSHLYV